MYEPFEHAGSVPQATYAKLDKVIIEQNDVSIQYIEGYMQDDNFISLGAAHVSMLPELYAEYEGAKEALIGALTPKIVVTEEMITPEEPIEAEDEILQP